LSTIDSGGLRRVTTRLAGRSGVALAPDGTVYVSDLDGGVTIGRVDLASGRVTAVTR
jgi:streptogramin lyase